MVILVARITSVPSPSVISSVEYVTPLMNLPKDESITVDSVSCCNILSTIADIGQTESLMDGIIDRVTANTPNLYIGDCLECQSSTLQEGKTEEQGKYPVYGAKGICGYLDYSTISSPAILIVKDGSGVGNVSYTDGGCSVVGTMNYLMPKVNFSAKFLYFVLKRFNFQPYKTGMAIPHIYFKAYSKVPIFCPSFEEQSRIAATLSRIENKIAIEERLYFLLQEQKRYLLSVMFI